MGFIDSAQDVFDKGMSKAKGAVSGVAVEQQPFMKGFVRLCGDGFDQGWHERNGGNLTYRMTEAEVAACRPFFYDTPSSWVPMGVQADNLRGAFFTATGSGRYMRNVPLDPDYNVGIVEINAAGDAWRIVWGLKDGGRPTSEFPTHFMNHSIRIAATDGATRVIYHAHCPNVIALSTIIKPDARLWSRILWKSMTECVVIFPEGVGVVPWMVPGGAEIAEATSKLMDRFAACVWSQHGLFVSGSTFDEAFGLMHTIEKSAQLYLMARSAMGGAEPTELITDQALRDVCTAFGVTVNDEFLD